MGLLVTAAVALAVSNSGFFPSQGLMIIAIVAQLGIVIGLSWAINRISATTAGMLFFVYSALTGFTFSIFFLVFSLGSIAAAFFSTAGVFGAMTVYGLTTKTDLTKFSSYFMMGLFGLIIASVINIFLGSGPLDFIISIFGVLLFTGLTAWDTQRIAAMATTQQDEGRFRRHAEIQHHGRLDALPRLHQPVHLHAAPLRRPRLASNNQPRLVGASHWLALLFPSSSRRST